MPSKLEDLIVNQDIYGHVIGVHYKGQDAFKTRFGAFLPLATRVLMIVNLIELLISFQNGSKQDETLQNTKIDRFYSE